MFGWLRNGLRQWLGVGDDDACRIRLSHIESELGICPLSAVNAKADYLGATVWRTKSQRLERVEKDTEYLKGDGGGIEGVKAELCRVYGLSRQSDELFDKRLSALESAIKLLKPKPPKCAPKKRGR
jgi:hypothetical protein